FAFGGANASVVWAKHGSVEGPPPLPSFDRVVVTGMATLTSAGLDPETVLGAVKEGTPTTVAEDGVLVGRVTLDASEHFSPKDRKRVDRMGIFALVGAKLALADAGIEVNDQNRARIGVI